MKKVVRVYIEGGAVGRQADQDFRRAWKIFLRELHELCRDHGFAKLEPVRGRGRGNAYKAFKNHHKKYPHDLAVLLADSEDLVPKGRGVWDVVARRVGDKWVRPSWAKESNLYLMVPYVETWLLTDISALIKYFGPNFQAQGLPKVDLEQRLKDDVEDALKKATSHKDCQTYAHGMANEIIEFVCPEKVKTLEHGERLFDEMATFIKDSN